MDLLAEAAEPKYSRTGLKQQERKTKMNNDDFMNFVGYQQYGGGGSGAGGGGGSGGGSKILVYVILFFVLCYMLESCGA